MSEPVDTKPGRKHAAKVRLAFMVVTVLTIVLVSTLSDAQTSFIGYLSMFPTYIVALMMPRRLGRIVFLSLVLIVVMWSTLGRGSDLWPLFFWVPVPVAGLLIKATARYELR